MNQSFDDSNPVTEMKATSSNSTVLEDMTYSYQKAACGGSGVDTNLRYCSVDHVSNSTTTFTYDALSWLTEAAPTGGSSSDYKCNFDANSNLCRTDGKACGAGGSEPYQYNAANELTSQSGSPVATMPMAA